MSILNMVGAGPQESRKENDFYPTPVWGTQALLDREKFTGIIWEPACGDGKMSEVLKSNGYAVISSDKFDYGYQFAGEQDFLTLEDEHKVDNIVTNPPFKLGQEFVEKALTIAKNKVAMLLRIQFLEGQNRSAWLAKTPLKYVYVFGKRLNFNASGGAVLCFAWFVWEVGYTGEPIIRWISPDNGDKQRKLLTP
jgi:hypothetical protein